MKKNTSIYNAKNHTEGKLTVTYIRCLNCDSEYESNLKECPKCKETTFNNLKYA